MNKKDQQALDELNAYIASRNEKTNRQNDKRIINIVAASKDIKAQEKAKQTKKESGVYENWGEKMKEINASPERKDMMRKVAYSMGKANAKEFQTPNGIFPSLTVAASYYNITVSSMWHRSKDHPDQYYLTSKGPGKGKDT
jgi:hypothetical protein